MTQMHAFMSLTAVNDTNACIRVIDHRSMTRMHASVSLTAVNDTDACIGVIDNVAISSMTNLDLINDKC